MKIVVVSDNHGRREPIEDIYNKHYKEAYCFIHCGDSELPNSAMDGYVVVQGNNDYYGSYPEARVVELGKHKALIIHGHRQMVYRDLSVLMYRAERNDCDLVFYGHTHIFSFVQEEGMTLLNPGSLYHNRDGTHPCYAILTIDDETDEITVERIPYNKS
ncbi:MAG: metallophosphoesterase family protein [Erysipelotrichaceae bacterium]|nr:metallophosphoesterase family protein [Erysipelotrichaceae bacterium]